MIEAIVVTGAVVLIVAVIGVLVISLAGVDAQSDDDGAI